MHYFVVLPTSVWRVGPAEKMVLHAAFIPTSLHFRWRHRRDLRLKNSVLDAGVSGRTLFKATEHV